jgi:tartrate-resistant acid phosphatase type 5
MDIVRQSRTRTITRRSFLKQTVAFSAAAALKGGFTSAFASTIDSSPDSNAQHILMLGDWGTNGLLDQQAAVAEAMRRWVSLHRLRIDALIMLGDNFYGPMPGGVRSDRWSKQFEEMYPASIFPGPAYAVLGNHDYENFFGNKVEAELAYSTTGKSRWHMPAQWYTVSFPSENPLITFFCLDSNLPGTKPGNFWPWSFEMSNKDAQNQDEWLRGELAKDRPGQLLAFVAHHPLYTNGMHGDNPVLISRWDRLLTEHRIDLYISGHDHDLQHLEFQDHPTSFVVSGGGGAHLVGWTTPPERRGPFGARALGFTDLEMREESVVVRLVGKDASVLHSFEKHLSRRPGKDSAQDGPMHGTLR